MHYHFDKKSDIIFALMLRTSLFCILILSFVTLNAQDTLPRFTVKPLGKNKVQISWVNPYKGLIQLNIQKSFDSTRNFRTIYTATSPELPTNGFIDQEVIAGTKYYYRIFYMQNGGNYFFSETISNQSYTTPQGPATLPEPIDTDVTVFKKDSLYKKFVFADFKKFRDSLSNKTKDTLTKVDQNKFVWKPFQPKPIWKASVYVFTNTQGYPTIQLPLFKQKNYRIVFMEEDGTHLFSIEKVSDSPLMLDKTNFFKSGWFWFELYENGDLLEKNKFFLGK